MSETEIHLVTILVTTRHYHPEWASCPWHIGPWLVAVLKFVQKMPEHLCLMDSTKCLLPPDIIGP